MANLGSVNWAKFQDDTYNEEMKRGKSSWSEIKGLEVISTWASSFSSGLTISLGFETQRGNSLFEPVRPNRCTRSLRNCASRRRFVGKRKKKNERVPTARCVWDQKRFSFLEGEWQEENTPRKWNCEVPGVGPDFRVSDFQSQKIAYALSNKRGRLKKMQLKFESSRVHVPPETPEILAGVSILAQFFLASREFH